MADYRAIAFDITNRVDTEISDADTLNVGNIAPLSGRLTLGGSLTQKDVYIANGHNLQVWGVGAELRTDGGADLIVGGGGSLQVPALGPHRIYGGTLSLEVPTTLSDTLTLVNGQTVTTTNNGDITLDPHGTGAVNIGSDFYATGFDLGDTTHRAGTLYVDTIDANNIIGPIDVTGTNHNSWTVNQDAVPTTPENVGVMWEAADGVASIHNWRQLTTTSGRELHVEYKQNPTDPEDLSEAGYTDFMWFDAPSGETTIFYLNVDNGAELGDGGGTYQIGSPLNPPVGDSVHINTTGVANGTFSISTEYFEIDLSGNTDVGGSLTVGTNVYLPSTSAVPEGVIFVNANRFIHSYGENIFVGKNSGNFTTAATGLITVGNNTLGASVSGDNCIAIGHDALFSNTQGHDNIAVGYRSLYTETNARDCIAIGIDAHRLNTSGIANIAIGRAALEANVGGVENTVVGYRAGSLGVTGSHNVFIGYRAGQNEAGDNKLYVANSNTATPLIYGDFTSSELTINADLLQTSARPFVINYDAAGGTAEIAGHVVAAGDGTGDVEAWRTSLIGPTATLWFAHKTNPINLADLGEAGYTQFIGLNPNGPLVSIHTDVLATGNDFGTAVNRLGTIYCTTLDATSIVGSVTTCGTTCNVWEVNDDAAGAVAENTGIALPAGDGVDVQNFQFFNSSSSPEVILRYKQNPTDPADFSELGYAQIANFTTTRVVFALPVYAALGLHVSNAALTVDANGIDCEGNIDLNNTLSFDAAGTIDTSGNNNLTINIGTGNLDITSTNWNLAANGNVTTSGTEYDFATHGIVEAQAGRLVLRASSFVQGDAPLIDLRTSVTDLDVPSGIHFKIGGVALTTALWTALGVDTILGGPASNADAYHTHSAIIGDGTVSNIWTINEDAAGVTVEDAALIVEAGDGVNLQNWQAINDSSAKEFVFQYKQNPVDPKDIAEAGYATLMRLDGATPQVQFPEEVLTENGLVVTNVGITMTGLDIGTGANRAGTGYFITLDTTNFLSNGTNSNVWIVNEDAAGGVAEDSGIAFPAGDGAAVQNFQYFNNSGTPEMILRYKQNPTDAGDFTEAGYSTLVTYALTRIVFGINVDANLGLDVSGAALTVDANGIDCTGNIDLNDTLSFDGVGFIDTSGNNNLTISTGTQNLLVTAGLVDLRTNVTSLDVPSGTGLQIGGVALTTANWTAPNVDTLLDGSNADALHIHSAASVSTNTANFDGILSAADTTVQAALETIDEVRHIGAVPAAPYDGQLWYDNTAGERILYVYDGSRTKWLSSSEFTLGWGHDNGDGELLRGFGANVPAAGTGVLLPKDATIVRIACRQRLGPNPKRFDILVNGASVFNFNTAANEYKNNTASIDLNEGDNLWVEVDSADVASQDVAVILWLAWRG